MKTPCVTVLRRMARKASGNKFFNKDPSEFTGKEAFHGGRIVPAGLAFVQGNAGPGRAYPLMVLAKHPVKENSKKMCSLPVLFEKVPL